jgi:hypothetical protein
MVRDNRGGRLAPLHEIGLTPQRITRRYLLTRLPLVDPGPGGDSVVSGATKNTRICLILQPTFEVFGGIVGVSFDRWWSQGKARSPAGKVGVATVARWRATF